MRPAYWRTVPHRGMRHSSVKSSDNATAVVHRVVDTLGRLRYNDPGSRKARVFGVRGAARHGLREHDRSLVDLNVAIALAPSLSD